jgi:ATP-dependent Lon protease
VTSLLEMLEPATVAQFECPYFCIPFDLSHANWVLTANDISTVPAPLKDRCRAFAIPDPSTADFLHVFDRLSAPIEDRDLISESRVTLATTIAEKSISLRQISALVDGLRGYGTTPEYH